MKLENQVCSLKLAKKLKELGVKQKSLFEWQSYAENEGTESYWGLYYLKCENDWRYAEDRCSAYTVAELGEMLPKQMLVGNEVTIFQSLSAGNWVVYYGSKNGTAEFLGDDQISTFDDTEADARATMLIYLFENNLITL